VLLDVCLEDGKCELCRKSSIRRKTFDKYYIEEEGCTPGLVYVLLSRTGSVLRKKERS
jgi:hypothetical protein